MTSSDNGYLQFIFNTHWVVWALMPCWLCCLFLCLIQASKEEIKFKKLRSKGESARGLVIANDGKTGKGKHQFTTTYIFNPSSNNNKNPSLNCKILTLIDGFAKFVYDTDNEYVIPSSITGLIAIFYGQSKWDKTSIIANITTTSINYERLKFGQEIEIMYDPKQPKVWNIPKIVLEDDKHKEGAHGIMIMSPCCIMITIITYIGAVVNSQARDYKNNLGNAFLFIMTLTAGSFIAAVLCICFLYWSCYTMDQHEVEAENLRKVDEYMDHEEMELDTLIEMNETNSM